MLDLKKKLSLGKLVEKNTQHVVEQPTIHSVAGRKEMLNP